MISDEGKQTSRSKRRKSSESDVQVCSIRILDWSWSYSFSLAGRRCPEEPFLELQHLNIVGEFIEPVSLADTKAEVSLMPDYQLNNEERSNCRPTSVGIIQKQQDNTLVLLPMPADALSPILTTLAAGKIRYVTLVATKMRYRKAMVRSFGLQECLEE